MNPPRSTPGPSASSGTRRPRAWSSTEAASRPTSCATRSRHRRPSSTRRRRRRPSRPAPALDPLRQLPSDFSATAVKAAASATAAATTPYEQAVALQDFFRTGFEYSLDVPAGHGGADIDRFLEARVGYCEQFSGAYAAMARSLGLPARVAVGFTPGEEDPDESGVFHVRGEHAHAWPEVYLEGLGWVAFEPTPGRGAPGAETYTGVPEQQQGEPAPGNSPDDHHDRRPPDRPTTRSTSRPPPRRRRRSRRSPSPRNGSRAGTGASTTVVDTRRSWAWPGSSACPPCQRLRRRRDRRRASGRPALEVSVAWSQAEDGLDRIGLYRRAPETPMAFADRVQSTLRPGAAGGDGRARPGGDGAVVRWRGPGRRRGGGELSPGGRDDRGHLPPPGRASSVVAQRARSPAAGSRPLGVEHRSEAGPLRSRGGPAAGPADHSSRWKRSRMRSPVEPK